MSATDRQKITQAFSRNHISVMGHDSRLLDWLQKAPEFKQLQWLATEHEIIVTSPTIYSANCLWRSLDWGQCPPTICGKRVVIWAEGRIYGSSSEVVQWKDDSFVKTMQSQSTQAILSQWAQENPQIFNALPGCAIIYSDDRDTGYRCLAAKYEFSEQQFNKPIAKLIGNPIGAWAEAISIPRTRGIEMLLESGEPQRIYYENFYMGANWRIENEILKLPTGEILVIVKEGEEWQRGYWRNVVAEKNS